MLASGCFCTNQVWIPSCVGMGSWMTKWIYENVSSLTVQHGKNTPHLPGQGRKFSSLNHPCSTANISYNSTVIYSTVLTQTRVTDWSSGFQFKLGNTMLLLTVPLPVIPLTVGLGENQTKKAGNNHATESAAFFSGNTVLFIKFIKTLTDKAPQCSHNPC